MLRGRAPGGTIAGRGFPPSRAGCSATTAGRPFEDVVRSVAGSGAQGRRRAGRRAADLDGDGWLDVFVANDGGPNHLWMNQKDGTFREDGLLVGVAVTAPADPEAGMGVGPRTRTATATTTCSSPT